MFFDLLPDIKYTGIFHIKILVKVNSDQVPFGFLDLGSAIKQFGPTTPE
jgi:hypothetical protein